MRFVFQKRRRVEGKPLDKRAESSEQQLSGTRTQTELLEPNRIERTNERPKNRRLLAAAAVNNNNNNKQLCPKARARETRTAQLDDQSY